MSLQFLFLASTSAPAASNSWAISRWSFVAQAISEVTPLPRRRSVLILWREATSSDYSVRKSATFDLQRRTILQMWPKDLQKDGERYKADYRNAPHLEITTRFRPPWRRRGWRGRPGPAVAPRPPGSRCRPPRSGPCCQSCPGRPRWYCGLGDSWWIDVSYKHKKDMRNINW